MRQCFLSWLSLVVAFSSSMKLSTQLALHNKSVCPEANWFSLNLGDCSV